MMMSLKRFKEKLVDLCLKLAWEHWTKLGIAGRSRADESVNADPEALILLAGFLSTRDLRLVDNVIGWLVTNESLVHKSRLKAVLDIKHLPSLTELYKILRRADGASRRSHWDPIAKHCLQQMRNVEKGEKEDLSFSKTYTAEYKTVEADLKNNRVVLRKLFGTTTRAELFNFFIGGGKSSSKGIADYLQLSQSTIHTTLEKLREIGLVKKQGRSRNTTYRMVKDHFFLQGLQPEVFFDWANYFRSLVKAWNKLESFSEINSEYKLRSALGQFYRTFIDSLSDWNATYTDFSTSEISRASNLMEREQPSKYLLAEIEGLSKRASEEITPEATRSQTEGVFKW